MSRRLRTPRTEECLGHRVYRTEHEAQRHGSHHPVTACDRCLRGSIWHAWEHEGHYHLGHKSVGRLLVTA